jgi:hypothetical protein
MVTGLNAAISVKKPAPSIREATAQINSRYCAVKVTYTVRGRELIDKRPAAKGM